MRQPCRAIVIFPPPAVSSGGLLFCPHYFMPTSEIQTPAETSPIDQYLSGQWTRAQTARVLNIREDALNERIREKYPYWIVGGPFKNSQDWKNKACSQWTLFRNRWPIERLKSMTVSDYTIGNQRCTFCYWLEHGTKAFATIGGPGGARMYECYSKDGVEVHAHPEISFSQLRQRIVEIAEAAAAKDFNRLLELFTNRCGLWPKVFWKIALLYQPQLDPFLLPLLSITTDKTGEGDYAERQARFQTGVQKAIKNSKQATYWTYAYSLMSDAETTDENPETDGDYEMLNEQTQEILTLLSHNKNIILQGAPGTGKTWSIPEIVTRLCGKISSDSEEDRHKVLSAYRELLERHQVVFTTFHPSYDYEDFVEGWTPGADKSATESSETSESEALHVRPGIFRQICQDADQSVNQEAYAELANEEFGITDQANVWKVSLYQSGINPVRQDCLTHDCIRIGWEDYGPDASEQIRKGAQGATALNYFYNVMKPGDVVISCFSAWETDAVGIIKDSAIRWDDDHSGNPRVREVHWLWKGNPTNIYDLIGSRMTLGTIYSLTKRFPPTKVKEFLRTQKAEQSTEAQTVPHQTEPYVLVIDEINRGNIAKIFGELITLLEPDKRKGGLTESSVTLPYSQTKFTVPENLYVIGTMNTADRSIGSIDYALRRRFAFYQMKPQELSVNFNRFLFNQVKALFLKDDKPNREYLSEEFDPWDVIPGQSYFVTQNTDDTLYRFRFELKPLLEEYLRDGVLLPAARAAIDALQPTE